MTSAVFGSHLVGRDAVVERVVAPADLAEAVGSGDVPALGTPVLIAWAEAASVAALASGVPPGCTTVGTAVELRHRAAVATGERIRVAAQVVQIRGRSAVVAVEAVVAPEAGRPESAAADSRSAVVVADGRITRALVDRAGFLARLAREQP